MKENWHNKELKNGLGGYDSPMDIEQSWEALEARRKPKKKRRTPILFWFFGLGVLIMVGLYILNLPEKVSDNFVDSRAIAESVSKEIKKGNEERILTKPDQAKIKESMDDRDHLTQRKFEEKKTRTKSSGSKRNLTSVSRNTKLVGNSKEDPKGLTFQNSSKNEVETIVESNNSLITRTEYKQNTYELNDARLMDRNLPAISIIQNINLIGIIPTNNLDFYDIPILNKKDFSDKSIVNPRQIGFSTSYSFLTSGLVAEKESALDAFSGFLFYEKSLFRNVYFKSGILFQQFTNRLNVKEQRTYFETEENVTVIINSYQDGSEQKIKGTQEIKFVETTTHNLYNRYRFISVPLIVGYKIPIGNESSLKFEGGISSSFYNLHSGQAYQDGIISPYENIKEFESKNIGVIQGLGSFYYELNLNKKSTVFFGSQITLQLNESVKLNKGVNFSSLGFAIGGNIYL